MNTAETGVGHGPSISSVSSAPTECRGSPIGSFTSSISALEQTGGKSLGENPFSQTVELKAKAPQVFDREVPGNLAFANTVPFEVKTELFSNPLSELEIIVQAENPEVQAKEVQENVQTPIEGPNLASLLEQDALSVTAEKVQPEIFAAPQEDKSILLLEKYIEIYGTQIKTEEPKTEETPSPLEVEDGEIKFALHETENIPQKEIKSDPASHIEVRKDAEQAQKVLEAFIDTGVSPKAAQKQVLADLREKWERTGLAQEIIAAQKPVIKAEVTHDSLVNTGVQAELAEESIQEVPRETYKKTEVQEKEEKAYITDRNIIIEEDPVAQAKRKKIAISAFAETVKEAKEKNDEINQGNIIVTGHDVAEKISSEQTDETTSEMVKYPVRRVDGSYKPYREDIDKIGEIKSVEEGLGDIEDALNNNKPLRVRGEVTTVEATRPEITKVAGRPIETIIYPKQAA